MISFESSEVSPHLKIPPYPPILVKHFVSGLVLNYFRSYSGWPLNQNRKYSQKFEDAFFRVMTF